MASRQGQRSCRLEPKWFSLTVWSSHNRSVHTPSSYMKTLLSQCRKLECYAPPPTSCTARDGVQLDGLHTHTRSMELNTHIQTNTHVHTLTDRQTDRHTHLSQSWHCSCSTLSQTDRQTHVHTLTDKQTDRHTHTSHNPSTVAAPHCHRQTDRQTDTRAHTHRQTDRQTHLSQSWHCSCVSVRTCERVTSCMSTRCLSHTWDNP